MKNETFYYIAVAPKYGTQSGKVEAGLITEFFHLTLDGELMEGDMEYSAKYSTLVFDKAYKSEMWMIQKISENKYKMLRGLGTVK